MTTPTITCEQFAERLADFLERDVDESTRARIELHALGCIPCGELLADLRRLRIDAANLPTLAPSRDLWAGIAERIETPVVVLAPGGRVAGEAPRQRHPRGLGQRFMSLWIGAAAAALVITTAVITHRITQSATVAATTPGTPTPTVTPHDSLAGQQVVATTTAPAAPSSPDSVAKSRSAGTTPNATTRLASNRPSAEETYDSEIKRLRVIVAQRRSSLDTATIHVIERNIKVIDDAIAQCKQALAKDPASAFLMESLNDALDTKVQLLRTAAMLPART